MRQVIQDIKNGETSLLEVPAPRVRPGHLLIRTSASLISAGTERMLIDFGRGSWLSKARQQPDKVRQVLDKVRTDGLLNTVEAVRSKLDQPVGLGYCNVGRVAEVPEGESGLKVGDRVLSNGQHAEYVCVPRTLCARIPDEVSDEAASFGVLGAIALNGVRLAEPTLGETFAVTGLGLIGLITVQILRANGCRVLGIDMDPAKCALAEGFGATVVDLSAGADPLAAAEALTGGRGLDGVVICASTRSDEPVKQAAAMCRKRGRIVLTGVTGLNLSRDDFYKKELSFQVSCSYGPGRYDPEFEDKGRDYPLPYVRWTEQRNFEAVLQLMAEGRLNVAPLLTHRFDFDRAIEAYRLLAENSEPYIGLLLDYPQDEAEPSRTVTLAAPVRAEGKASLAVIGAGNYASRVLVPALSRAGARLRTIASGAGLSGTVAATRQGFEQSTTETDGIFTDPEANAVVVATRHDSHARYVQQALKAGKHVWAEKPLCLTLDELEAIRAAHTEKPHLALMVGFNRRFSPLTQQLKAVLDGMNAPKAMVMTVNAGAIPADHWTQDRAVGGGRIVGEACHFIDLLRHLAGAPCQSWSRLSMDAPCGDAASLSLGFADGSMGTVHYLPNGPKSFPKERLEVFCGGAVLRLDNFRELTAWGVTGFKRKKLARQDKGQDEAVRHFVAAVEGGGPCPVAADEIFEVSRIAIELA